MGELFRRATIAVMKGIAGATLVWSSAALAQGEPPARVGRLAFINGAVSFHDDAESAWTQAVVNTPITTGDAIWTEPNARSEISLAGTRIRLEGASELDMLALDDSQTRMRLSQGRIDIKTVSFDPSQPYQIVTPRGTISLLQQGDYYIEAGSLEDPTRLGVRSGAAQIESLNGQVLAVRAGEVGEVLGDASMPQLRTVSAPPPAPPAFWANRDRQVVYDQAPQYIPAGVTGYEDLNAYGNWVNDGSYGMVWVPRAVPAGWAPYRTGHWAYQQPWGWTWIDEQPWGFAPYHYGRWANRNNRWMWVPPQRDTRPVYAPALVAFVGGVELAVSLADRRNAPVGWFPLGPREVYVPAYTTNRDYYQRINRSAAVQDRMLDDRWRRTEWREGGISAQNLRLMNQRYATVVPTNTFVQSQPVSRAALRVAPDRVATVPVIPIAAPPAPTLSVTRPAIVPSTTPAPNATVPPTAPANPRAQAQAPAAAANVAVTKTAVADMPTLAKPTTVDRRPAPGPQITAVPPAATPSAPVNANDKPGVPKLVPRQGGQPPVLQGTVTPVPTQTGKPGEQPARPDTSRPATPPQPPAANEPPKPGEPPRQQATPTQPPPAPQPPKPAEPAKPQAAPATPPPAAQQPKPGEPPKQQAAPPSQQQPAPQPTKPVEAPRQQAAPQPALPPPRPPEPPKQQAAPPPQQQPAPQPPRQVDPPRQQVAPQPAPPPTRQAEPPRPQAVPPPQQQQPAPQPPRQAEPPRQQAVPQPRPVEPPRPPQAAPQAPPQQAVPPPPRPPQEGRAAPPPPPRPQAAPPAPAPSQAQTPPPQAQPQQPPQPPRPAPAAQQRGDDRKDDKK